MISTPMLPPLKGYVEVEVNGERKYKNVETGYILGEEPTNTSTDTEILNTLLGVI